MEEEKPSQQAYMALIVSILGCMGCGGCITGLIGAIMGKMELDKINRGESEAAGAGLSKIAMGLGITSIVIWILGGLIYAVITFLLVANS